MILLKLRIKIKKPPDPIHDKKHITYDIDELRGNKTLLMDTLKKTIQPESIYPVPLKTLAEARNNNNKSQINQWNTRLWGKLAKILLQ